MHSHLKEYPVSYTSGRISSVDQYHYSGNEQIKHRINHYDKNQSVLINNNEPGQKIKQQMDDSAIDQIPVITENVPHYNANTYDCSHE